MYRFIKRVFSFRLRRRRRFRVRDGAYVVLSNSPGKFQIDDIGFGGLSFHYIDNGLKSKGGSQDLKIMAKNQPLAVYLAGTIVAENETGELIFENKKIKRRSVRFDHMNMQNRRDLESFIKSQADTGA